MGGDIMKLLYKIFQYLVGVINIAAAIITIVMAVNENEFSFVLFSCGVLLVCSTIFLYVQLARANNKLCALKILAHRGKVYTTNFIVYLDFLRNKFNDVYDNEPKTNSLYIKHCEFNFHYLNKDGDESKVDIDYLHRFWLSKHKGKLDFLILHSNGHLRRRNKTENEQDDTGVYIRYQEEKFQLIPKPCVSDTVNTRNQVLDRVECSLPKKVAKKELLEFHYQNEGGGNLQEDAAFVIYPQNYGKKFSEEAIISVTYDRPYCADIQLVKLPYGTIRNSGMQHVAKLKSCDGGKCYRCCIDSVDIKSIYLVIVKRIPLIDCGSE